MEWTQQVENGVCFRLFYVEIVFVVIPELVRIELLGAFYQVEIDIGVFVLYHPGAVRHPFEFLFDAEFVHPVQVDIRGGVQQEFF